MSLWASSLERCYEFISTSIGVLRKAEAFQVTGLTMALLLVFILGQHPLAPGTPRAWPLQTIKGGSLEVVDYLNPAVSSGDVHHAVSIDVPIGFKHGMLEPQRNNKLDIFLIT